MTAYIPEFYPDEILYSYLARYQKHTMSDFSMLCRALFAKKNNRVSLYHIDAVTAMVDSISSLEKITFEEILSGHTLFPYFTRFVSRQRREQMIRSLILGKTDYLLKTKGRVIDTFKYCPICFEDDLVKFGESYWHREHNIPDLSVCPKHNCVLQKWSPPSNMCRRKLFAPPKTLPRLVRINKYPLLLDISKRQASYLYSSKETDLMGIVEKARIVGLIGNREMKKSTIGKVPLTAIDQLSADQLSTEFEIVTKTLGSSNLSNKLASGLYPAHVAVLEELIRHY